MKKFLHLFSSLLSALFGVMAVIQSCTPSTIEVIDRSYVISAQVRHDAEQDQNILYLQLNSGDSSRSYKITYSLDGEYESCLLDEDGAVMRNNFSTDFKKSPVRRYLIQRELSRGEHSFGFEIECDGIRSSLFCPFTVDAPTFDFHADLETSTQDNSFLLLSLDKGDRKRHYSALVYNELNEMIASLWDIDFEANPIPRIPLPVMRPGEYTLRAVMNDGISTVQKSVELSEPLRFRTIEVSLSYNDSTGEVIMSVARNPYSLWVDVKADLTVNGTCKVNQNTGYFVGGPTTQTYTKTLRSSYTPERFIPKDGANTVLCDFLSLDRKMESLAEDSYVWAYGFDSNRDDIGWQCLNFTLPEHYKISGREAHISITFEPLFGVTPVLRNRTHTWISPQFMIQKQ